MYAGSASYGSNDRQREAGELVWKVFIVLVWLVVPLSAWFMLRLDHQRYLQDSAMQQQACEELQAHIRSYSELYMIQATAVYTIDSSGERRNWEREWDSVQRLEESDRARLSQRSISYFPESRQRLDDLNSLLERQRQSISEAARLRESYIKSADALSSIAERIDRARMAAEYYRRLGAEGIYLLVMEDMAILEARYRDFRNDRQQLLSDAQRELGDAEAYGRQIMLGMRDLDQAIANDAQTSYNEKLKERFADFNLRSELDKLISGEARASQPVRPAPANSGTA